MQLLCDSSSCWTGQQVAVHLSLPLTWQHVLLESKACTHILWANRKAVEVKGQDTSSIPLVCYLPGLSAFFFFNPNQVPLGLEKPFWCRSCMSSFSSPGIFAALLKECSCKCGSSIHLATKPHSIYLQAQGTHTLQITNQEAIGSGGSSLHSRFQSFKELTADPVLYSPASWQL